MSTAIATAVAVSGATHSVSGAPGLWQGAMMILIVVYYGLYKISLSAFEADILDYRYEKSAFKGFTIALIVMGVELIYLIVQGLDGQIAHPFLMLLCFFLGSLCIAFFTVICTEPKDIEKIDARNAVKLAERERRERELHEVINVNKDYSRLFTLGIMYSGFSVMLESVSSWERFHYNHLTSLRVASASAFLLLQVLAYFAK